MAAADKDKVKLQLDADAAVLAANKKHTLYTVSYTTEHCVLFAAIAMCVLQETREREDGLIRDLDQATL